MGGEHHNQDSIPQTSDAVFKHGESGSIQRALPWSGQETLKADF